ncbi:hypothetical protein [Chishuiella changwenlii]|nr:hypothetical protein [Chishuiella changwenlii]
MNLIILSLILIISCDNQNSLEKSAKEIKKNNYNKTNFIPDIRVNDIELSNSRTFFNGYKNLEKLVIENNNDLPFVSFVNNLNTEKFTVYFFYGSTYDEFYQFKIEYLNNEKFYNYLQYDNFITESGIKLGLSKKDLIKIKGNNYKENNNVIKYIISDYESSPFLQKYNLPAYFSEYTFINGKLIKIYFGFEYP